MLNELSLFSGAGGGLLGTKLLGFKHVGYVEFNEYCQKVIAQRIKDGILDNAPIFGDIRTFINQGYADGYSGLVDVVTAGFPCQPFSVAGKQHGENDERNMWPETIDVIRRVRPRFALLENVPGLFAHDYIRRIFGDLAESGFDARWRVLSAAELGAPHKRDRVWIVAHANELANGEQYQYEANRSNSEGSIHDVADSKLKGLEGHRIDSGQSKVPEFGNNGGAISDTNSDGRNQGREGFATTGGDGIIRNAWWNTEPDVGRVANGVASRVDRLKAIGNGQVPAVVASAWSELTHDLPESFRKVFGK